MSLRLDLLLPAEPIQSEGSALPEPLAFEYPWPPEAPWVHLSLMAGAKGGLWRAAGELSLDLDLVAFSKLGAVDEVVLVAGESDLLKFSIRRAHSPKMLESHPECSWAAEARLSLVGKASSIRVGSNSAELIAVVSGQRIAMGKLIFGD